MSDAASKPAGWKPFRGLLGRPNGEKGSEMNGSPSVAPPSPANATLPPAPPVPVPVPSNAQVFGLGKKGGGLLALANMDDDSGDEWSDEEKGDTVQKQPAPPKKPVPSQPATKPQMPPGKPPAPRKPTGEAQTSSAAQNNTQEADIQPQPPQRHISYSSLQPQSTQSGAPKAGLSYKDPFLDESGDDSEQERSTPAPKPPQPPQPRASRVSLQPPQPPKQRHSQTSLKSNGSQGDAESVIEHHDSGRSQRPSIPPRVSIASKPTSGRKDAPAEYHNVLFNAGHAAQQQADTIPKAGGSYKDPFLEESSDDDARATPATKQQTPAIATGNTGGPGFKLVDPLLDDDDDEEVVAPAKQTKRASQEEVNVARVANSMLGAHSRGGSRGSIAYGRIKSDSDSEDEARGIVGGHHVRTASRGSTNAALNNAPFPSARRQSVAEAVSVWTHAPGQSLARGSIARKPSKQDNPSFTDVYEEKSTTPNAVRAETATPAITAPEHSASTSTHYASTASPRAASSNGLRADAGGAKPITSAAELTQATQSMLAALGNPQPRALEAAKPRVAQAVMWKPLSAPPSTSTSPQQSRAFKPGVTVDGPAMMSNKSTALSLTSSSPGVSSLGGGKGLAVHSDIESAHRDLDASVSRILEKRRARTQGKSTESSPVRNESVSVYTQPTTSVLVLPTSADAPPSFKAPEAADTASVASQQLQQLHAYTPASVSQAPSHNPSRTTSPTHSVSTQIPNTATMQQLLMLQDRYRQLQAQREALAKRLASNSPMNANNAAQQQQQAYQQIQQQQQQPQAPPPAAARPSGVETLAIAHTMASLHDAEHTMASTDALLTASIRSLPGVTNTSDAYVNGTTAGAVDALPRASSAIKTARSGAAVELLAYTAQVVYANYRGCHFNSVSLAAGEDVSASTVGVVGNADALHVLSALRCLPQGRSAQGVLDVASLNAYPFSYRAALPAATASNNVLTCESGFSTVLRVTPDCQGMTWFPPSSTDARDEAAELPVFGVSTVTINNNMLHCCCQIPVPLSLASRAEQPNTLPAALARLSPPLSASHVIAVVNVNFAFTTRASAQDFALSLSVLRSTVPVPAAAVVFTALASVEPSAQRVEESRSASPSPPAPTRLGTTMYTPALERKAHEDADYDDGMGLSAGGPGGAAVSALNAQPRINHSLPKRTPLVRAESRGLNVSLYRW